MRAIVDRKGLDRRAATASRMGRFETEWLATQENLAALTDLSAYNCRCRTRTWAQDWK